MVGRAGVGDDDTKINMVDANGVVMVATQALYRRVIDLEGQVAVWAAAATEG